MTDDELKALVASLAVANEELRVSQAEASEELRASQAETSEQMKRTDEKLERIGLTLGNMGRNQGDVAEEFFYNSLISNLQIGSIQFEDITKNMEKHRGKIQEEYDLFLTNGNSIAVIEVKYKAHLKDIDKLDRKVANFKKLFPIYKNHDLYGGLASFNINDDAKEEALSRGYFVLQRSGDVVSSEGSGQLKHW